jgi:RNA polymerase sigma-70 factor (ECF subfamily)
MGVPDDEVREKRLVESAANGDAAAFTEIFNRYYPMIHAFAYRLCLEDGHAQDIAQETFIKAARALGSFRAESSLKHWLYRIAANTALDFGRKRAREAKISAAWSEAAAVESETRSSDFSGVGDALASLGDDLRRAIVLVYYEDLSHSEAARILGCAETTISWRVFTAKRKLKRLLAPREDE